MELRKDPITQSWIVVADEEPPGPAPAHCPYCDASEPVCGAPIFSMPGDGRGYGTHVYPHPRPLYCIEGDAQRAAEGIYDRMRTVGAHELIIESPDHNRPLWMAGEETVERVLLTYAHRIEDLKRDVRFKYVTVFKNRGGPAGEEITHPHSELTATTFVPRRLRYELRACKQHYQLKERCVFCDMLRQDERQGLRLVEATPNFVTLCPFAPRVPYETWILPRYHQAAFETDLLRCSYAREIAGLLQRTLARLENLAESFHMVLHTIPNTQAQPRQSEQWNTVQDDYHWHFEILPITQKQTKSYSIKEVYFCPVSPERAAARLRETPTTVEVLHPSR